ncbi:thiamine pyrophosphokinase [Trinorchestia longiramus]|nr:thiamine pyrophosphokinase [Trinorchestia longiramus]
MLKQQARVRVCVDGATNGYHKYFHQNQVARLHETNLSCEKPGRSHCNASIEHQGLSSSIKDIIPGSSGKNAHGVDGQMKDVTDVDVPLPDFICGDFDSARPELLQYYSKLGVPIIRTDDQNYTDFYKGLQELKRHLNSNPAIKISHVIVAVQISAERFDHVFANINSLFKVQKLLPSTPVVLVSSSTVQLLLPEGESVVVPSGHTDSECNFCAYIPLCGPTTVTTTGLKWDVENATAQFGGLVSTSNQFASSTEKVHITTDKPLLFIMNTPVSAAECSCDGGLSTSAAGDCASHDN